MWFEEMQISDLIADSGNDLLGHHQAHVEPLEWQNYGKEGFIKNL